MHKPTLLLLLAALACSCVPNRKVLYLQKNDLVKHRADTSIARAYTLKGFDYKIQTNDIISVRYQSLTQKEFDFLGSQNQTNIGNSMYIGGALLYGDLVDEKGEIPMPVVGKVKVAGLTIYQIQDTLQALANKYLEAPVVKARLLNYRAVILGEVKKEGDITFNNNRVSLMEAIGMAGGLGELADRSNIKIIRQQNSKVEVHYVNVLEEDFLNSPFYYVHQNDLIIVPPLRQRPYRLYFGQNVSLILSSVSILLLLITLNKK
ncbi:MAG: polysaccharide biosynthesis/export family protein [Bacteroidetes bacterium]|nr:polysaccharide biosynthesis/export family protein [Bacteroidota bacterium]